MARTASPWQGHVQLGLGWAFFHGVVGDNHVHAHHALQAVLGEQGSAVHVKADRLHAGRGLLIGADVSHQLLASRAPLTLVFIDRESRDGQALNRAMSDPVRAIPDAIVDAFLLMMRLSRDQPPDRWLAERLTEQPALLPVNDALIEDLLPRIDAQIEEPLSAATLASSLQLSPGRFLHRFRAHTGLPLRPYLRWRRLVLALQQMLAGLPLTEAAHAAGFSDAAHFTRTCRRHFGLAPSALKSMA